MPQRVKLPDGRTFTVPDDASMDEILAAANEMDGGGQAEAAQAPAAPQRDFVDALPSIGGTVMSLAGGSRALPTGMALGALGGAAGEGVRQVVRAVQGKWDQVPASVTDQIKEMGSAALAQGGLEAVGRGLSTVAKPVGKGLYYLATRPSAALRKDYGLKNLINQGFDDKILPNRFGEARAGRLVKEGAEKATEIAKAKPHEVDLSRITQRAIDDQQVRATKELVGAGVELPKEKVLEQVGRVVDSNPRMVNMEQLLQLRRNADDVAEPVFRAAKGPGGAGRVPVGSEASVAKSLSTQYTGTLRDTLGKPFEDVSKQTQRRYGAMRMAKEASERPSMLTNLLAGGVGVQGLASGQNPEDAAAKALLFKALFSPNVNAAGALLMPGLAKQAPRGADMATQGAIHDALQRLLSEQEPR
jgi:hypothetical protein